jgi:hypothetical protein
MVSPAIIAISGHRSPSPFLHASPVVTIAILAGCVASVIVAKRRWRRQYEDWRHNDGASNPESGTISEGPRYSGMRPSSRAFTAFALLCLAGTLLFRITHGASPILLVSGLPIVPVYWSFRFLQSQRRNSKSGTTPRV